MRDLGYTIGIITITITVVHRTHASSGSHCIASPSNTTARSHLRMGAISTPASPNGLGNAASSHASCARRDGAHPPTRTETLPGARLATMPLVSSGLSTGSGTQFLRLQVLPFFAGTNENAEQFALSRHLRLQRSRARPSCSRCLEQQHALSAQLPLEALPRSTLRF